MLPFVCLLFCIKSRLGGCIVNSAFRKEIIKVGILLGIGVVLLIAFVIYGLHIDPYNPNNTYNPGFWTDFWSCFIFIGVLCYPVGIVYGWKQILNFFLHLRGSDRAAYMEHPSFWYSWMNFWFSVFFTIFFGWIFGVFIAAATLIRLRRA